MHHQPPGWSVVAWRETFPSKGAFSWPLLLSFSHITYADSLELKLEDFVHTCSARTPPRLWNNSGPPPLPQPLEGLWWLLGLKERWFSWELYSYCGQPWFGCLAMCLCQPFGLGSLLHPHSSPRLCWKRQHPVTPTKVATEQKTSWKMFSIPLLSVHLIASRVFSSHIFSFPFLESVVSKEVYLTDAVLSLPHPGYCKDEKSRRIWQMCSQGSLKQENRYMLSSVKIL